MRPNLGDPVYRFLIREVAFELDLGLLGHGHKLDDDARALGRIHGGLTTAKLAVEMWGRSFLRTPCFQRTNEGKCDWQGGDPLNKHGFWSLKRCGSATEDFSRVSWAFISFIGLWPASLNTIAGCPSDRSSGVALRT
jgi:hypothetical protein